MPLNTSVKISKCLAHIAELRERARADADPASKAELRDLELQWMAVVDSYRMVEQSRRFLKDLRVRQSAPKETRAQTAGTIWPTSTRLETSPAANGTSLADLLEVLVCTAIEHTRGNARAAFYLADAAGLQLHHVIGMPDAYARCVNGFAIGTQSLACGLAAATGQSVITPDVSGLPRTLIIGRVGLFQLRFPRARCWAPSQCITRSPAKRQCATLISPQRSRAPPPRSSKHFPETAGCNFFGLAAELSEQPNNIRVDPTSCDVHFWHKADIVFTSGLRLAVSGLSVSG